MADVAYLIKDNKTLVEGVTKDEYNENYVKMSYGPTLPPTVGGYKAGDMFVVVEQGE